MSIELCACLAAVKSEQRPGRPDCAQRRRERDPVGEPLYFFDSKATELLNIASAAVWGKKPTMGLAPRDAHGRR